jgi:eukaryotic-like serine/threonine-protein kinase
MSETQIVTPDQIAIAAKEATEVLPGYTLERRIGSGGFGEVWKAAAPGGLEKAVKILYGHYDEEQAESELKSLERVRSLHHPFLLNIERIEIASGRLIIVTELAEESLEDRFKACRKRDWQGIPYEELLGYLRDAADALDFMSTKHGLQHLDVKPDNLLLQSGHVKVADFGLTKDLSQSQVSLVGAFTPLYAPPELYEGQPSPSSDQYSLAIVYQVMLTGLPPFLGRTAAQLASQHLSSLPNLQPLPIMDRPAIARALSKNPDARFPSCREFLDELARRRSGESKPRAVAPHLEKKTQSAPHGDNTLLGGATEFVNAFVESRPFKTVGVDAARAVYRPTLIVGLGGMAGRVLCRLKQRIQGRFGAEARLPGLGLLYLDSDSPAVSRATRGEKGTLSYQETLAIPLRSPQDYKLHDVDFSDWLSRRWLFNIPRTRQVQSMRALGRLAFADHQKAIRQRIREHLARMISEDSLSLMRDQTGLPFEKAPPNVLVLASITGGTGGGAVLDLGYLLRDELSGMALEGGEIEGLLMFGTDFRDGDRDVTIANGLCVLRELEHFICSSYPGDPTCGLPEISEPPFHHNFLIHLGEELNEKRIGEGLERVAEYLYRDTLTPAQSFFRQFRNATAAEANTDEVIHTFGVRHIHSELTGEQRDHCRAMIRQLMASWIKPVSESELDQIKRIGHPWCDAKFESLGWKLNQLQERGLRIMQNGDGPKLAGWLSQFQFDLPTKKTGGKFEDIVRTLDRAFEDPTQGEESIHPQRWLQSFHVQLQEQAEESVKWFRDALWNAMDYWPHPLDSASFVVENTIAHLEACRQQLSLVVQQITDELVSFAGGSRSGKRKASHPNPKTREELNEALCRYADLRFCHESHRALLSFLGSIQEALETLPVVFGQIRQTFSQVMSATPEPAEEDAAREAATWADRFDQEIRRKGRRQLKRLSQATEQSQAEWFGQIEEEARRFVLFSLASPSESEGVENPWKSFCTGAKPQLDGVGGLRSAVLMVPNTDSPELETWSKATLGECVSVLVDPHEPLFLCCETRNLSLAAVQNSICEVREDLKEVAARLHTRIDVNWND